MVFSWLRVLQRYFCNNCLCWLNSSLNLTITVSSCEMIFFDFSSDKLSFVLGIFSFFYNQLFFGTFWKSNIISLYLCLFENFLYFFKVLYTFFILEYRLLILTVVVSTLTILHKTECNFFWFPLNFSNASTTRRFFNGNGCLTFWQFIFS